MMSVEGEGATRPQEIPLATLANDANLKEIFAKLVKRAHQDFLNSSEALWRSFIDQMAERIQRRFWREWQQAVEWKDQEPVLYPENTRLFYPKGKTTVVLIEQKPMVRTVKLAPRLILPNADPHQAVAPFTLALPYIIYAFKFYDGGFSDGHVFFMKSPLRSLSDRPLAGALPNLSPNDCRICFGNYNASTAGSSGDYGGQVDAILDYYWNSTFTTDWSDNYQRALKSDARMETARKWSETSKKDPLFVLSVNWPASSFPSFRHLCSHLFSTEQSVREMKKSVYDVIIQEEVQSAFREFRKQDPEAVQASSVEVQALMDQFVSNIVSLTRSE